MAFEIRKGKTVVRVSSNLILILQTKTNVLWILFARKGGFPALYGLRTGEELPLP